MPACSSAAWAWRSSREASRRRRSIGPIAGRRDDPSGRARRQSGRRPPLHGRRERVLDRLLGEGDVTEDADQGRDRAAVLLDGRPVRSPTAIRPARSGILAAVRPGGAGPRSEASSHGRACAPHSRAASRSAALMIEKPPMCSLPSVNGPSVVSSFAVLAFARQWPCLAGGVRRRTPRPRDLPGDFGPAEA